MSSWIDFKELRRQVDFAAVLRHYGVELKIRGRNQHQGFCPLPSHRQHSGQKRSPSFSANLDRKIFNCFSCNTGGNCVDFVALMEGLDPQEPGDVRKAAVILQDRFLPGGSSSSEKREGTQPPKPASKNEDIAVMVNAPLDFELKHLDTRHPYLKGRGFTDETIDHFGLGFCSKGLMKDRIAIPLHDPVGRLIGYAGRVVDDSLIGEQNPKYRFPGDRERGGKRFAFEKSRFVYNGHRITTPVSDLVVVEGFASVWWLFQNRQPNVVALMGASCSEHQVAEIIRLVKPDGRIWILTDGDEAGDRCATTTLPLLAAERFTHWRKLEPGKQPTDLSGHAVHNLRKL